jgi:ATP-dependent DNA ligase
LADLNCFVRIYAYVNVGTGLSNKERQDLFKRLEPCTHKFDRTKHPPGIWFGSGLLFPDVWFEPEKLRLSIRLVFLSRMFASLVVLGFDAPFFPSFSVVSTRSVILTIKASSFARNLRFPRVVRIREDKSWDECVNIRELFILKLNGLKRKLEGGEKEPCVLISHHHDLRRVEPRKF